jgi:hypothetical protein
VDAFSECVGVCTKSKFAFICVLDFFFGTKVPQKGAVAFCNLGHEKFAPSAKKAKD